MDKIDISSLNIGEMEGLFLSLGEKGFRAKQVYSWLHQKLADNFQEMTDLSKALRAALDENCRITTMEIIKKLESKEDGTIKYLFRLENNSIIESVLMRYSFGNSVCISTQAGCRMGCTFCASTVGGLERNLTAGEMLYQIYKIQKDIGERISNIVLMGSGEPLDNYENVLKFLEIINSKDGLDIGQRHITLSTCGLTDKIYALADLKKQINLAVSLHAPNNHIREKTMPVAKKYAIEDIFAACRYYAEQTGRRVTYEYALIDSVNNLEEHARELGRGLQGTLSHVNLIPVNEVKEKGYQSPSKDNIQKFARILKGYGIETTVRRTLGSDINAACGQLRANYTMR